MLRKILFASVLVLFFSRSEAQIKILFDATKAEMAANADWVIDANLYNIGTGTNGVMTVGAGSEANPQRIPTPAQSGITAATTETYWTGSLSNWAIDLVKKGYTVETLPYNAAITYGNGANVQDLSNYKVFIIDEPNTQFSATEKTAIVNFVKNGGGLFIISDHTVSDRNSDGWDSPDIWNDLFSTNTVQANPFGITFDLANFSQTSSNVANLPTDTCLHGPMGNVTQLQFTNGTTMTLSTAANATVRGLIYKTGSSNTGTTNVMFARARYGTGKVCSLSDSSCPDDGTGDPNDVLYNGYTGDASGNHQLLLVNAVIWLASQNSTVGIDEMASAEQVIVSPNPFTNQLVVRGAKAGDVFLYDITGKEILKSTTSNQQAVINTSNLTAGFYFLKAGEKVFKVVKN